MIYTHTIGRIGKDCQVITGTHGTLDKLITLGYSSELDGSRLLAIFMAVDIAVDDYAKGQNITTWVRVRKSQETE